MHSIDRDGDPTWRATSSSGGTQPRRNVGSICLGDQWNFFPLMVSKKTQKLSLLFFLALLERPAGIYILYYYKMILPQLFIQPSE